MAPVTTSGLRSRKIDYKKSLVILHLSDLLDFDPASNLSRNIVSLSTGVEKEEEDVRLFLPFLSPLLPLFFFMVIGTSLASSPFIAGSTYTNPSYMHNRSKDNFISSHI